MEKVHIDLLSEIEKIEDKNIREITLKLINGIEMNSNDDRIKKSMKIDIESHAKQVMAK